MDTIRSQKSVTSTSNRSFLSRTLGKREDGSETRLETKGPLGLHTLNEPSKAVIAHLIFVHGLGGGSRSTWTYSNDPSLYWPSKWLPTDPAFQDVRVHSFGYNSNWEKESTLNLHDFAKSLLGSIQDCAFISRDVQSPLVFVGHSMGGLVIKRAYILARQKSEFSSLAKRVRAILFLATPHRGADLAQLLTKILHLTSGARPFVADLHRNSIATQSINDEFPQHCQDLQLFSFYETLPTNYGVGKSLVVDKDLATLGYVNERTAYLNANHREVCKFSTQANPDYQTIRNALASTIDHFREKANSLSQERDIEQQRLLDKLLGITDAPEDDFMDVDAMRMRGSCDWLISKESYKEWQDSPSAQMYWLDAKPATGKTILSGRIVHHLKDLHRDLSFYFFDYRSRSKTSISAFLLSIVWQMARMHSEVLTVVLDVFGRDDQLSKADYRTIWRKLFTEAILRMSFIRPQYWVIDALDECKTGHELVPLLLKILETSSIRIFLTSRDPFVTQRHAAHSRVKVISASIPEDDTRSDINIYLQANMDQLPSIDDDARQSIVHKILQKSGSCFLWVSLMLQELRWVHTSAEVRQVLEDVPSDMNELYSRILDSMSKAPYGKKLAKAILTWTVCSARPLTTDELYHALQIDMKDRIDSIERSIVSSCSQLVYIDTQHRVQMIHQTARDFLLQAGNSSEFGIDAKLGQKQLAMTCLQYLNGREMQGPRHRRLSSSNTVRQSCPFVAYACNLFFEHVDHANSTDADILLALSRFLTSSNVLAWIEWIALHSSLQCLIQAGKAFKSVHRRFHHMSPVGKEVAVLGSWAIDLVRLVTKFGQNLIASPSAIFHLIPPFCPPETAPRKYFAASTRGIAVLGLSATCWDDCLCTIGYGTIPCSALACSDIYFAVGLINGKITVYNGTTCQEVQVLQHQELIKILSFGRGMDLLASSGLKVVRLWDTRSWKQIWNIETHQQCMTIAFLEEQQLLLGALRNNQLIVWDLVTGIVKDSTDWTLDLEGPNPYAFRQPMAAAFCIQLSLLAVVYRGQDILLLDLARDSPHEMYSQDTGVRSHDERRNTSPGASRLVFSASTNLSLLAASYSDGDLVLFDVSEGTVVARTLANAQELASSSDGRTLACGNSSGTIQLFDFETLKLLYRINSDDMGIQGLAFCEGDHHLIDTRGSQCRVWDPVVLVRQDVEDESSDIISISMTAPEITLECPDEVVAITSLAIHKKDGVAFCGKEDGSVYVYETKSGRQSYRLFHHGKGAPILSLHFDEDNYTTCSVDASSRILVHTIVQEQQAWRSASVLFNNRVGVAINQILNNADFSRLLVCMAEKDILWSISPNNATSISEICWEDRSPHKWGTHPSNPDQLILIQNDVAHLYNWETLQRLTNIQGILLKGSNLQELSIHSLVPCSMGASLATTFGKSSRPNSEPRLLLWDSSDFIVTSESATPIPKYRSLASQIKTVIGEIGQKLVFLHNSGWVCSANLHNHNVDDIVRHFFLPRDWLSTSDNLIFGMSDKGDILFVKRDELAVIKRGLENVEQRSNVPGKPPSLLGGPRPSLTIPEPE